MPRTLLSLIFALIVALADASASGVTPIARLDCTTFSDGSELNPSSTDISNSGDGALYNATGWRSASVYPAGGAIAIAQGGSVTSPALAGSGMFGGVVRIAIEARSVASKGADITLAIGSEPARSLHLSDRWQTVCITMTGATNYNRLIVSAESEILLRSIKVDCSDCYIPTPLVHRPQDAVPDAFTAEWDAVASASAYIVTLYCGDSLESLTLLEERTVAEELSCRFDNLERGQRYWISVAASDGINISDPSQPLEVLHCVERLETPSGLRLEYANEDIFKCLWDAVDGADSYRVTLYRSYVADRDESSTLLYEDFSGVNVGDLSNPAFFGDLNDFTSSVGWQTDLSKAFADGCFLIIPLRDNHSLTTPAFATASSSEISVQLYLAEISPIGYTSGGTVEIEIIDSDGSIADWSTITLSAPNIAIYSRSFSTDKIDRGARLRIDYHGDNALLIDKIIIYRNIPEGATISSIEAVRVTSDTSAILDRVGLNRYYDAFTVTAISRTVRGDSIATIESPESQPFVIFQTGIPSPTPIISGADTPGARRIGPLTIEILSAPAQVYDLSGRLIRQIYHPCVVTAGGRPVIVVTEHNTTKL